MILSEPLNTLFVTLPGAYLAKDHENLVVKVEQEERVRVPLHHVGSVVLFGGTIASIGALGVLAERGIQVSFLTAGGEVSRTSGGALAGWIAASQGPVRGRELSQGVTQGSSGRRAREARQPAPDGDALGARRAARASPRSPARSRWAFEGAVGRTECERHRCPPRVRRVRSECLLRSFPFDAPQPSGRCEL